MTVPTVLHGISCKAFCGGRILTMDMENPEVETVIFQNGRIIATGSSDLVNQYPVDEIIDLNGRTLLPGFIDSHLHLSFGCFLPEWADLTGCRDKDEILTRLKEYADLKPRKKWIVGFPWFDEHYGGISLTREDLDAAFPDVPAILIHTTFHSLVANTRACTLGGVRRDSPEPNSGFILKQDNGELSGVLIESACIPVLELALDIDTEMYAALIERAAKDLFRFGITAIHDPGVTPSAEAAYKLLHARERLPVSVLMMPHGRTLLDNQVRCRLQGEPYGSGDEHLRVGPVKVFGDGACKETTAYSLQIKGTSYKSGVYRDDFSHVIADATRNGFQVCIHCLGNRTVDAVLESIESTKTEIPTGFILRPRLEHLNLLSPEQIIRLSALHACASVQPQFLKHAGKLNKVPIEGATWFAYHDLMKNGIILGGSSDYPGGFMDGRDVIACICMAATMSDGQGNVISPDQVMPFEQWLWIYTAGSAGTGNQEHERGMLCEGMVADFVILNGDLDTVSPPVVDETWIAGNRVYSRNRDDA